jgi:hypothetical protein
MMRKFFAAAVASAVALVGFAGSAIASATIDLLWPDGTTMTDLVNEGDSAVVNVVLTAGPNSSDGGGLSIDYSSALGILQVTAVSATHAAPLSGTGLGEPTDNPTTGIISNMNDFCFGLNCLVAGSSYLMGTITFQRTGAVGSGDKEIVPFVDTTSTDGLLDGLGSDVSSTSTFNSAFVNVPEPGAISLLVMGLGGMLLAGRGRRS